MTTKPFYPYLFEPVLKDYVWGGRNLEKLGRHLPEGIIAESWEIAAHEAGTTTIQNGSFAGQTLTHLQDQLGLDLVGHNNQWAQARGKFPLLVKLLDANRHLSVQVHPDDTYALQKEGNELGKTEMWVILHAEPGAEIILGVKRGTTAKTFREAIAHGRVEQHLHRLSVKTGDHVCVPAGSLHAIMEGVLIAEIQQNSNTTYRVYDWGRMGHDGRPRPLHIDKALEVINFSQVEPTISPPQPIEQTEAYQRTRLCQNKYFVTERLQLRAHAHLEGHCQGDSLEILGVLSGEVRVNDLPLSAVQFTLLPAQLGLYTIQAQTEATLLKTYTPNHT